MSDSSSRELTVEPILPGRLAMEQIAELTGVRPATIRNYRVKKAANLPEPTEYSGQTPLWDSAVIVDWINSRPQVKVQAEVLANGKVRAILPEVPQVQV